METIISDVALLHHEIMGGGIDAILPPSCYGGGGSTSSASETAADDESKLSNDSILGSTAGAQLNSDIEKNSGRGGKINPQSDRHKLSSLSHSERYLHEVVEGRLAPSIPYDVRPNVKSAAKIRWDASLKLAEVVEMSGKFWSKFGFSINRRDFLFPEEALYLAEQGSVIVVPSPSSSTNPDHTAANTASKAPIEAIPLRQFYATVMQSIPPPVYLAYVKLKDLDYVVTRFRKSLHLLGSYDDLGRADSDAPLLYRSASFSLFLPDTWSKKAAANVATASKASSNRKRQSPAPIAPVAYVIVTTAATLPPTPLLLKLLDDAASTPIIFAVVARSGQVSLTEFSDASLCLDWTSPMRCASKAAGDDEKEKKRKAVEPLEEATTDP